MSKGYTFYAMNKKTGNGNGVEIAPTTIVKDKGGEITKSGRIRLRFFNFSADSSRYFMMTPEEAYTLALKASDAVMESKKHTFTHVQKKDTPDQVTTKLLVDCFQYDRAVEDKKTGEKRTVTEKRFALVWSRGEQNQVNVPMSAEAMLYFAELARAFSVEQAWTSYKKPGTDGETPERGEQDTETPGAEIEEVEEPAAETAAQAQETAAPAQADTARFRAVSVKGLTPKAGRAIVEIDGKDVFETRYTKRAEGVSVTVGALVEVAVENGYITDIRAAA